MTDSDLAVFARDLPKAELHVHIEGTLEPELFLKLAERNGVDVPFDDVDEVRAAYSFTDLQSFLDIYYQGAGVLQTEQDFAELMAAYLHRAHADGVRRAEIFFDPQTHTERGVPFEVFMAGFQAAIHGAQTELGISVGLIMCPLSNLALGMVDTLKHHNLKRSADRGVLVTINSDDPACFGGYVADNYTAIGTALGLSREDLAALARNSLEACFAPVDQRRAWLLELEDYVKASNHSSPT